MNMDMPMDWGHFKVLSKKTQEEYILHLRLDYGATGADIARMFGVSAPTIRKYCDSHGIDMMSVHGNKMSQPQRKLWADFLDGKCAKQQPEEHSSQDYSAAEEKPMVFQSKTESTLTSRMSMKEMVLKFEGSIEMKSLVQSLTLILGDKPTGTIEIRATL